MIPKPAASHSADAPTIPDKHTRFCGSSSRRRF